MKKRYLNIVGLIDGTCNDYKKGTNVSKLEKALYADKPYTLSGSGVQQLTTVSYRPGPATDPRTVIRGAVWAADLARAIGQTYEFIATEVKDNPPAQKRIPRLFLFGFSRGAYSVHVLSWLLQQVGIPKNVNLAKKIAEEYCNNSWASVEELKKQAKCYQSPRIKMLGCWDIVTSLLDTKSGYHDSILSPLVDKAYHAMAANERRKFFPVKQYRNAGSPKIEQVWFSGVHGDVGGTYADDRYLSDIAYNWLACKARKHGLGFKPRQEPAENETYDFSALTTHDEAWTDAENRRYHRGEAMHPSLIARLESDSSYEMNIARVPRKLLASKGFEPRKRGTIACRA